MLRFRFIGLVLILLLDIYLFFLLKYFTHNTTQKLRIAILSAHCIVSFLCIISFFVVEKLPVGFRNYVISFVFGIMIAKLFAVIFFLIDDFRRGIFWIIKKIFLSKPDVAQVSDNTISRSVFLSWLGTMVGGGFLALIFYGFSNKYNYQIKKIKLSFSNLPDAFKGLKIVQFSDVHSGSFTNKKAVDKGISLALQQKPDLILFTGDLVNDHAAEMQNYKDIFARLSAPMGVYSILGNHDYGDYFRWSSEEEKKENLEYLKKIEAEMGWRLLMNEHIIFERNGEKIALLGIENWSALKHFPKHGKLDIAYAGTENIPFKILMSHDPTHWDAQVRPQYSDIDLTLSGHTHGMQFGVETPHFKWSPVQWVYKEWAGLYQEGKQFLYVNCGFGFLGYPGRVGILPEITVFELA